MRSLAKAGTSIIFITHKLNEVLEVADRITVLRLGKNVGVYDRRATTQQDVVHAITAGVATKVAGIPQTDEQA
jgi:ABC-type uncharacterized transport system ATPase subunit